MKKIVHLTSVHPRHDTRIFFKMCCSLAKHNYDVYLVVADGKGEACSDGVSILDVGVRVGRIKRMLFSTLHIQRVALDLDADLYHFHDPELIFVGLYLRRKGYTVIFDAHEDVPKQLLGKTYLNRFFRLALSKAFSFYENWAAPKFNYVVAATPYIREKYLSFGAKSEDINNFPILGELAPDAYNWSAKHPHISYVGVIAPIRGVLEMVRAMDITKTAARLQLGGNIPVRDWSIKLRSEAGWQNVDELGWLNRKQVSDALQRSVAGLVTLHPESNYLDALPVKMFEYMSAAVPVIASNFPLWRDIIERANCGICVDPLNPAEIAEAIDYLISNPSIAEEMGRNGRLAVEQYYNWSNEKKKLFKIYDSLLISA